MVDRPCCIIVEKLRPFLPDDNALSILGEIVAVNVIPLVLFITLEFEVDFEVDDVVELRGRPGVCCEFVLLDVVELRGRPGVCCEFVLLDVVELRGRPGLCCEFVLLDVVLLVEALFVVLDDIFDPVSYLRGRPGV